MRQSQDGKLVSPLIYLAGFVCLGFALRIWGIGFGLPYAYHPDEGKIVSKALGFGTGDLNPHFFRYPTLYLYIQFILYGVYFVIGKIAGTFQSSFDFALSFAKDPTAIYMIGRTATALFGTAMVPVTYLLGKRLYNQTTGLLASFFIASSFLLIQDSHFVTTDIPLAFFILVCALYSLRASQEENRRDLYLAAFFCGLAASTKYNGALAGLMVLAAAKPFAQSGPWGFSWKTFAGLSLRIFGISLVVFLAGSPFVILDFKLFLKDFLFEINHAGSGHLGFFPQSLGWRFHLSHSLVNALEVGVTIAGVSLAFFRFFETQSRSWPLAAFTLAWFMMIGATKTPFERYAIPMAPFIALYGAEAFVRFSEKVKKKKLILGVIAFLTMSPLLVSAVLHDYLLTQTDTRTLAKDWVEKNVPPGSSVVVDGYGPQLFDPDLPSIGGEQTIRIKDRIKQELTESRVSYRVVNLAIAGNYSPEWLLSQKPDYIILSSFIADRMRDRAKAKNSDAPFLDWVEKDLPLAVKISPYRREDFVRRDFEMKSLYSPAKGDLFYRHSPGPELRIYGPLNSPNPEPKP